MENWISLAVQVPIVGLFIWFTLEMNKRNQEAMATRDEAYLAALEKITQAVSSLDTNNQRMLSVLLDRYKRKELRDG